VALTHRVAKISAWTRIHRGGQHAARGKCHGDRGASNGHRTVLKRPTSSRLGGIDPKSAL
jgi:hypothetical protein